MVFDDPRLLSLSLPPGYLPLIRFILNDLRTATSALNAFGLVRYRVICTISHRASGQLFL